MLNLKGFSERFSDIGMSPNNSLIWIVFLLFFFAFVVSGFIIAFHWRSYGTNARMAKRVEFIFIAGGAILLTISAILIPFI